MNLAALDCVGRRSMHLSPLLLGSLALLAFISQWLSAGETESPSACAGATRPALCDTPTKHPRYLELRPAMSALTSAARHCPSEDERKAERDACLEQLPADIVRRGQAAIRELNSVTANTGYIELIYVPSTALPPCDDTHQCRNEWYYADCVEANDLSVEDAMFAPTVCLHERSMSECGLIDRSREWLARESTGKPWIHMWDASWSWWIHKARDDCTSAERRTSWLRQSRP